MNKYYCICRDGEDGSRRYLTTSATVFTANIRGARYFSNKGGAQSLLKNNEYLVQIDIKEERL